jgi:hypothetical protein
MEKLTDLQNKKAIAWLLASENPAIHYRTLTGLLDLPQDDPSVLVASAAIPGFLPVAALLDSQKPAGYWVQPDYYIPKHYSTFWVLCVLADLGLTNENEYIKRGCEYLFAHQREDGQFCRRRRGVGRGMVWEGHAEPCTHARIVRLLLQAGYAQDTRTRSAMDWLLSTQRPDGMWLCWARSGAGCLRATLDFLRAAVLDPHSATLLATTRAAFVVCDLLMQPGMGRFHVGDEWYRLVYPYFSYGVIPTLEVLAQVGYAPTHLKLAAALGFLLGRRLPDGSWPMDESVFRPPLDFGQPGASNPWLTLDALIVLKRLGCLEI